MKRLAVFLGVISMLGFVAALRADEPSGPVFCRYVLERADDFAWENDLVAFRVYGPALKNSAEHENSGIDCWFKRTTKPIINEWYGGEKKGISYHRDHGDGYDGYHVGSSRGCGGTSIWRDGKLFLAGVYATQRIISQAPEKCVFELSYQYSLPDGQILEVKRITLEAGKHLFCSESTFTKDGKPAAGLEVAVGVTTHDGRGQITELWPSGLIAVWETIDGKGVGTGVVLQPGKMTRGYPIKSSVPDESHAVFVTHTDADGKEMHYAGFTWEGAGNITTAQAWDKYLMEFAEKLK